MLQNLLPKEEKKNLEIEYYTRLVTIVVLIFTGAVGIGVLALVPGYIHVIFELQSQEHLLDAQKENIEDSKVLTRELSRSTSMLKLLEKEAAQEKVTTLLGEVIKERPSGIVFTGFSYYRDTRKLSLEGIASTRDLVVPFAQKIESNSYFEDAPIPLADLAKNTNLNFHLNISIAEQKATP